MSENLNIREQREALRRCYRLHTIKQAEEAAATDKLITIDEDAEDDGDLLYDESQLRELLGLDDDLQETTRDDSVINVNASGPARRTRNPIKLRNLPPESPWDVITQVESDDLRLRLGKSVELVKMNTVKNRPNFFTIRQITRNRETGQILLHGIPLWRNLATCDVPGALNEVHMRVEQDLDDSRPLYEQAMVECHLTDVLRLRHIKYTHRLTSLLKSSCELVCRWLYLKAYPDAAARLGRNKNKQAYTDVRPLYEGEHAMMRISPHQLISKRKTSSEAQCPPPAVSLTYNTGFCGCGGDALGARLAGFKVLASFDLDQQCCATFQRNFPSAVNYVEDVHKMIHLAEGAIPFSTVWHLSCPCQTWSSAHTKEGKNDPENMAALFSIESFLKKISPTMATFEQTSGLKSHNPVFFAAFQNMITSAGYKLRWKICDFQNYGLPSSRKRLVVYAVQPGYPFPEFPAETHGPEHTPYVTARAALSRLPRSLDWHLGSVRPFPQPYPSWNPDRVVSCLVTGGTSKPEEAYHFSGRRRWTVRELACLNGFPSNFKLPSPTEVSAQRLVKQIGNAVPPVIWHKFMILVKECLTDFAAGKIDEAGNRITLQELGPNINSAARELCEMSLEPSTHARSGAQKPIILSLELLMTPSSDRGLHNSYDKAPRAKRKFFINLFDDENVNREVEEKVEEASQAPKKAKLGVTIDLTLSP